MSIIEDLGSSLGSTRATYNYTVVYIACLPGIVSIYNMLYFPELMVMSEVIVAWSGLP